ncbi:MAG: cytochrome P450, partial [Acidobacteriota bacterium]
GFYLIGDHLSFALDGEPYMRFRRVSAPLFSARGALKHIDTIRRLTREGLDRLELEREISMQPFFDEVSLRTTARILFGSSDDRPEIEALIQVCGEFVDALKSPWVWIPAAQIPLGKMTPWGRFVRLRRQLFDLLGAELDRRVAGHVPHGEDLLSAYLGAFDLDEPNMRRAILEDVVGYLVGGSDTTAKMMNWTLFGLLRNREAFDSLRTELDEQLGDAPIASDRLKSLPYLHSVMQEGLRYRSPGPFAGPRQTVQPIRIGEYDVPADCIVAQCFSQTGRNQEMFPHAGRFEPGNFFERPVKMNEWLPFGGGQRICAGMGLAQLEIAVVLGTVVRSIDFDLLTTSDVPSRNGVGYEPRDGLRVIARHRSS